MKYRITEARAARGITQATLAESLGVTQQAVARWESGDRDLKASVLIKLSKALGVSVAYILGMDVQEDPRAALSKDEVELIDGYRSANAQGRAAIMAVMRASSGMARGTSPNAVSA